MTKKEILNNIANLNDPRIYNSGIYTIYSKSQDKYYVGMTRRSGYYGGFQYRWLEHIGDLLNNKHSNKYLQNIVNKYTINDLYFEIIDEYENDYCESAEQYWINLLDSINDGFNCKYKSPPSLLGEFNKKYIAINNEEVINDYIKNKLNIKQIAKKFNVSEFKISKILKNNDIKIVNRFKRSYDLDFLLIYKEYLNDKSLKYLSKKYKVDVNTIKNYFKIFNLPLKKRGLTKKETYIIYNRYLKGENIYNICKEYNVDNTTVYNNFKIYKLDNKYNIVSNNIKLIYNQYKKGISVRELAQQYNVERCCIYRNFKKYNLEKI